MVAKCLLHSALASRGMAQCGRIYLRILSTYITDFVATNQPTFEISPWLDGLKPLQTLNLISVSEDRLGARRLDVNSSESPDLVFYLANEEDDLEKTETFLQQMMLNVPELQSLLLDLADFYRFRTRTMFLGAKWSNLTYLSLSSINIAVSSFKMFLTSHVGSLQVLQLFNAQLSTTVDQHPAWIDFFKFMSHNLQLSHISLGGLLSEVHGDSVTFDERVTRRLRSGLNIDMQDLARFLVCGQFPAALTDPLHPDRKEFTNLDWQVLMAGYDSPWPD